MEITFDASDALKQIAIIKEKRIPQAAATAVEQTGFQVMQALRKEGEMTFDSFSRYTRQDIRYTKAKTKGDTVSTIVGFGLFAFQTNRPMDYIGPYTKGAGYPKTKFRQRFYTNRATGLDSTIGLAPNRTMVPTDLLEVQGKVPAFRYSEVMAVLARSDSLGTRSKRAASRVGRRGYTYMYMDREAIDSRPNFRSRKPGIFLRDAQGQLKRAFTEEPMRPPTVKYNFFEVGQKTATDIFPNIFTAKFLRG